MNVYVLLEITFSLYIKTLAFGLCVNMCEFSDAGLNPFLILITTGYASKSRFWIFKAEE